MVRFWAGARSSRGRGPGLTARGATPSAKARLRNFCLLEPTIRGLGVRFDSKDALAIMARERGVAARLLYQIKMAIDNLSKRAPISTRAVKAGGVVPRYQELPAVARIGPHNAWRLRCWNEDFELPVLVLS